MAGIPHPRLRVSRSGLYDSQDNYPSNLLHDSAQLGETSAPFMNQPSMEDSVWPSHAPQDTASGDDSEEHIQYSSNSATPGPPTRTAGAGSIPQLRGGNNNNASPAAALKDLVKRLGTSSNPSRPAPPPAPRSEADSDILESDDDRKQMHSIRTTFRQAAGQLGGPQDESDAIDLATPKQTTHGSRIPVSSGRPKQRRLSLEKSTATAATGFKTSFSDDEAREEAEVSRIASSALDRSESQSFGDEAQDEAEVSRIASSAVDRSNSKSFEALQARLDSSNLDDYLPSSEGGFSPPASPRIENLNESTIDLTAAQEVPFPQPEIREETDFPDPRSPSPIPSVRPRTTSASGTGRPRSSLSLRQRPVSSLGREFGEISFPSGEVDFSTPIKTKAERQLELERSWGRASGSGPGHHPRSRTISHGSIHDHSRSNSPALHHRYSDSRDEVRAPSPLQTWEKDRERNWNSPRPKDLGARPPSPPRAKRASLDGYGSTRSRSSSISSIASVDIKSKGKEREHSLNSPPPAPSPAPSSPSSPRRVRTVSSPTAAEIIHERERSWNRPHRTSNPTTPSHVHSSHAQSHSRTPAMSMSAMNGLDSAVTSLRSSTGTPPALSRSRSLGHNSGRASPGGAIYQSTTPSTSFSRRSSVIDAVKEETEPESSMASQRESELATSHPQVPMPRSTTPPVPQSGSETSSLAESEELKGSQSEQSERGKRLSLTSRFSLKRDASRLKKLFSGRSRSKSPAPQSTTTPQASPPRPEAVEPESKKTEEAKAATTTPQSSPVKSREIPPATQVVTPTKRPFHQFPTTLPTPSPPKGGLPALPSPSESEGEEEAQLGGRKSASRTMSLFGASRFLPKTPKFPGAWGTPGTVARAASPPPFDDREHPHPKGKAVEALKLKAEDAIPSDSDASTPVVRPREVPPEPAIEATEEEAANIEPVETPERVVTPPPDSAAVTKVEPKTPHPPGGWGRTPSQRKSILKVRFDAPGRSPDRPRSHPSTPDEVKEKGFKLLESLGGIMADEGYGSIGKNVQRPATNTPTRGPTIVDGRGRPMYASSDGAFIQRLDQRGRTMSTDSAQSSSSIGQAATTAIEVNVTESRKRGQTSGRSANPEDVSLNSPVYQGEQDHDTHSDGSSDDSPYPTKLRIRRIRHAIDDVRRSLDGNSSYGSEDEPSLEQRLELDFRLKQERERSLKAQAERRQLQRQMQSSTGAQGSDTRSDRTSRQSTKSMSHTITGFLTVKWTLFVFAQLIILWFMLEFAKRHAETLFYTIHYDPTWAGHHDIGDPHAPTASQWLMLGRDAASAAAWFEDFLYHHFGIYGGRTTLRPNLVPT